MGRADPKQVGRTDPKKQVGLTRKKKVLLTPHSRRTILINRQLYC